MTGATKFQEDAQYFIKKRRFKDALKVMMALNKYHIARLEEMTQEHTVRYSQEWTEKTRLQSTEADLKEQLLNAMVPDHRQNHTMAFDSDRGCMVLFGGEDTRGQLLNDTWEYWPSDGWKKCRLPPDARINALVKKCHEEIEEEK